MTLANSSLVHVVDDDGAVREALSMLLRSVGFSCREYGSALDFLDRYEGDKAGCLVLDLQMPGMDGLTLQETLADRGCDLPIVFLTGHGDVPAAVAALRAGAVNFMEKPFDPDVLLQTIASAIAVHAEQVEKSSRQDDTSRRLDSLTPREKEIFDRIMEGKASKVVAIDLGISERTVELHRSRILRKLGVSSVTGLMSLFLEQKD